MKTAMKTIMAIVMFSGAALSTSARAGEALQTQRGTMMLGGQATFQINSQLNSEADDLNLHTLTLAPSFGYFVLDNLALTADLGFTAPFGDFPEGLDDKHLQLGAGLKYFIPTGGIVRPYLGLSAGVDIVLPEGMEDSVNTLLLSAPLGVLVSLNRHVAIDVGARVNMRTGFENMDSVSLSVPMGYLGVQAVF